MAITPAAKVGLATVAAAIVAGAGFAWLTNFSFGKQGYEFRVVYGDVAGLMEGAGVMLMGVKVGQVEEIRPEERRVVVKVRITRDDVKILDRARFMIMSQGIIGEKTLEIFPPTDVAARPDYIEPGEVVRGNDPTRIELVMEELGETFKQYEQAFDPQKFQDVFNQTAENLLATTATIRKLGDRGEALLGEASFTLRGVDRVLAGTERLLVAAKPEDVAVIVSDIKALSSGLNATYRNLLGEPEQQQANLQAMRDIQSVTRQLDQLANNLNRMTGDQAVQADIRETIKNIRRLTGAVTDATQLPQAGQLEGLVVRPRLQGVAAHTPSGTGLAGNLGLKASMGQNYLQAGIEQIGEGNYLNLAFGDDQAWGQAGFHFGLIRSKIGVGIDYDLAPTVRLMGQLYDPFRPTFRLGTTYFPVTDSQYGLLAQWARTFQTNENFIWLGVEWRPLDGEQPPRAPAPPAQSGLSTAEK